MSATRDSRLFSVFDRYARFTDLKQLNEWSSRPLRKSMRVNTLKCSIEDFKAWAKYKKWTIDPVPWCPEGFFVDRPSPLGLPSTGRVKREALGKDVLHLLGGVYMQEAASMLPVALLDPKPGDRVLDMSSAPGSKTTQIAARMEERGILVANDVQEKRIWGLLTNLQRCGVMNVIVTKKVGQWFAGNMTEMFDRVLCDAPCTAQGTVRKDSDALRYASEDNIGKMAKLQRELLESAVHACKVGGRIVYSTCTLTPEENEDVVLSILNKFSTQLVIINPEEAISGERLAISKKGSSLFDAAMQDSFIVQQSLKTKGLSLTASRLPLVRLWPQTFDTEGFFCAVIEKRAPTKDLPAGRQGPKRAETIHQWPVLPKSKVRETGSVLEDWYGARFMKDGEILTEEKEQLSILPEEVLRFPLPLKPYYAGLPFAKSTTHGALRLSHETATLRGGEATKQIVSVSEEDFRKMIQGVNVEAKNFSGKDGDVLLALVTPALKRPLVFGRGLLKNGIVLNRLPRDVVRMFT